MNRVYAMFGSAAFALSAVAAIDVHVSPLGDDSSDGSQERPFATLAHARDAVRAARKSGAFPKGGVNVWLHGGEYAMRETLSLGANDSGAADSPVSYRAWKGESPALVGAWTVPSSAWRKADDPRIPAEAKGKVWVADVKSLGYDALEPDALCGFHTARPEFRIRSLYCDGKRLTPARHPNTGFLRTGKVVDRAGVFKGDIGDMARWSRANAPDLEALGYWRYLWADQTLPVRVDPAAGTVSFAPDAADSGTDAETSFHLSQTSAAASKSGRLYSIMVCAGMPFYLQNALAALDAPGEWHLDRTTGLLYVRPEDAKGDPSKCRYELSLAAKSLVSAKGAAHIRFEGIAFRGGRHHGVEMRGVSDVKIENCDFRDFGGHGLVLDHARDSLVRGCSFRTFGHSAMTLDGGDRKTLTPSGVTIDSCSFSDTGLAMRTYTPGIWVTGCGHRIVRNNFHDLPSSAVRIGGNEHLFASNLVERVVMESASATSGAAARSCAADRAASDSTTPSPEISCTATASTTARRRTSAACRYTADATTWCATTCSRDAATASRFRHGRRITGGSSSPASGARPPARRRTSKARRSRRSTPSLRPPSMRPCATRSSSTCTKAKRSRLRGARPRRRSCAGTCACRSSRRTFRPSPASSRCRLNRR